MLEELRELELMRGHAKALEDLGNTYHENHEIYHIAAPKQHARMREALDQQMATLRESLGPEAP